jgi:stage V sporulation protein B
VLLLGGAFVAVRILGIGGATGAAVGFVAAAALIVPVAAWRAGLGTRGAGGPTALDYARLLGPLLVGQLGLNLLLQTDLLLLSNLAGEYARAAQAVDPEREADVLLGAYRGVQLFGFLPYQLLMSIQFVLFPMLAKARTQGDHEAVERYVRTGVRLAFVFTGLVAAPIAGLGVQVLRFAFPETIASLGQQAIRVHATGLAALAILGVCSSALTSLGRERWSAMLTWLAVGCVAAGCFAARAVGVHERLFPNPLNGFGTDLVFDTAVGTASGMLLVTAIGAGMLRMASGAFVAPLVLARVGFAMAVTIAAGTRLPWLGKLAVPALGVVLAALYAGVLVVTRELGASDLAMVRAVVGRKRPSA